MKLYELETYLNFGKYEGKTLSEVIKIQPDYVNWCILHLDHFLVNEEDLEKFQMVNSEFIFSTDALKKMKNKWDIDDRNEMARQEAALDDWDSDIPTYEDWLNDEFGDDAGAANWNMD